MLHRALLRDPSMFGTTYQMRKFDAQAYQTLARMLQYQNLLYDDIFKVEENLVPLAII